MPASVKGMFDWDISPYIENELFAEKFYFEFAREKHIERKKSPLLMIDRKRFDHHLIKKALSLGRGNIIVWDEFPLVKIGETKTGVLVGGPKGKTLQADFAIAADGSGSKTAKLLGLNKRAFKGLAVDARVEVPEAVYEEKRAFATFNYNCIPNGYGWIFPKKGYLSCGIGSLTENRGLVRAIDNFLGKSFPKGSILSVRRYSGLFPIYAGHQQVATRRVCLVGDAASLVDPITGEGIRYALESGKLAAEVITKLMTGSGPIHSEMSPSAWGNGGCLGYQQQIHEGMGRSLDILYRLAFPIRLKAPEFFYEKFILEGNRYLDLYQNLAGKMDAFKTSDPDFP